MSKRFIGSRQTTIAREVELSGTGVHSGAPVSLVLHPAEADTGYKFLVSKRGRIISEISADVRSVKNLTLCTVIGDDTGVTVSTVPHVVFSTAHIFACVVDDTLVVPTLKVVVVAPAGTVTVAGTVAGDIEESCTVAPPAGAGAFNVTVAVADVPA